MLFFFLPVCTSASHLIYLKGYGMSPGLVRIKWTAGEPAACRSWEGGWYSLHKNGNSSTVSPAAVVVTAVFCEGSGIVQRLIQLPPNCTFQLKDISIAEHGNVVILLPVQQNCRSENNQAVTSTVLRTFSRQFLKERMKRSFHCFLPLLSMCLR